MEKRQFKRVSFQTPCRLAHDGSAYDCRSSNISVSGAMVSFDDSVMIPTGDGCTIEIFLPERVQPLRIDAKVIYSTMFNVGLQFTDMDDSVRGELAKLIASVDTAP